MSAAIARRVARGAALLDEKRPGWDARIDLAGLDLEDCELCVVGQLFGPGYGRGLPDGSYGYGLEALGVLDCEYEYGFDREFLGEKFADLTAEWRRVITARRGAAGLARAS